eukprot:7550438-Pyramimonas_sp.AAC.2
MCDRKRPFRAFRRHRDFDRPVCDAFWRVDLPLAQVNPTAVNKQYDREKPETWRPTGSAHLGLNGG